MTRTPLLLYLDNAGSAQRAAVGATLAAAAGRAGWAFDCYFDALRAGRHFGGGDPRIAPPGWPAGSLVAGGRHAELLLWAATAYELVPLGDPQSALWPMLEGSRVEPLVRSTDAAELFAAAFERLGQPLPSRALVLDGRPQGRHGLVVAPYLYPSVLQDDVLATDAAIDAEARRRLESLGVEHFCGLYVGPDDARNFPGGLDRIEGDAGDKTYVSLTSELAERHASWGRGILLGDPDLVAAQLPRAHRLRLLPLYGQPQTDVIERAAGLIRRGREPVFGRQYDDHDFFALGRLGHGLQVLDPDPPFDATRAPSPPFPTTSSWAAEPDDGQLERWADEGRVLLSLLFWCGMVREVHCLPALIDLAATTGLRGGLIVTDQSLEHAASAGLPLVGTPVGRGVVLGRLELLLGSTGSAVAAEALMPPGALAQTLTDARARASACLPDGLLPRGWWPLLDGHLVPQRGRSRVGWRGRRPVIRFTSRGGPGASAAEGQLGAPARHDLRALAGATVRQLGLEQLFEERRPFEGLRPGSLDPAVASAVAEAGFSYMWSKTGFGKPRVVYRDGEFLALSLTAGHWDGWSPFYTVRSSTDLARAERRLLQARQPGWLVANIDSPLWALPGELWEHGSRLYRMAALAVRGGLSGRLVNVTPHVVARYARVLERRQGGP